MPTTEEPKGLHRKMAAAQAAIGRMQRSGHADVKDKDGKKLYSYDYLTESDLMNAVKKQLSKVGVAIYVSCVNQREEAGATRVEVEVTFADGETGETFTVKGQGAGTDKGDKGVYKAQTGAVRYVLWKTFLVPTGDEPDAEHIDRTDHAEDAQAATRPKRMAARIVQLVAKLDEPKAPDAPWADYVHDEVMAETGLELHDLDVPELEAVGKALVAALAAPPEHPALDIEWPPRPELDLGYGS